MKKKRVSHKHFGLYSAVMAVAIAIPLIPSIGINVEEHLTGSITGVTRVRVSRRDVIARTPEATSKLTQLGKTRRSNHPLARVQLDNATVNANRDRILRTLEADRKAIIETQRELKAKLNTPGLSVQSRAQVRAEIKETTKQLGDTNRAIGQLSGPLTVSVTPLAPTVPANAVRSERRNETPPSTSPTPSTTPSGSIPAQPNPGTGVPPRASPTPSTTPSGTIPAQPNPGTGTPATPAVPNISSSISSSSRSSSNVSTSVSSDSFSSQVCTGPTCNNNICNSNGREACCTNGDDDDNDGNIDSRDSDCSSGTSSNFSSITVYPGPGEDCSNGEDDDGDTRVDCRDSDCASANVCQTSHTSSVTTVSTTPSISPFISSSN